MSGPEHPSRELTAALALVLVPVALLPASMLALSAARVPMNGIACLVLAGVAVAAAVALASAVWREADAGPHIGSFRSVSTDPLARAIALITLAATLAVAILLATIARQRPVIDWDGLYYHVPALHAWARAGRIVWIDAVPDVPFVNGYPMALETLGLWTVQVLGHDHWIDAANLALWPVGALGMVLLARCLGAHGAHAWIAVAALAGVPSIIASTATAYVDVGFACASAAAFALTLRQLQGARGRGSWTLWGASLGLLASVKGTGIPLAALLAATVAMSAVVRARGVRPFRSVLLGCIVALAIGGGWPVRALVHTGNPIHPIELRLGAKVLAPGYDAHAAADLAMPADLRALPAPLRAPATWLHPLRAVTVYDQTEGLGPLWTFAGWPGVLFCTALAIRRRETAVLFLLGAAALWWFAQPASWWARFSFWIVLLGWPAAVAVIARIRSRTWRTAGLIALAVVITAAALVSSTTLQHERAWAPRHGVSEVRDDLRSDAIAVRWPAMRAQEESAEALADPRIARTRIDRLGTLFAGALAQPAGMRTIVVVEDDFATRMQALDLRWLWWDEAALGEPDSARVTGLVEVGRHDLGGSAVRLFRRM